VEHMEHGENGEVYSVTEVLDAKKGKKGKDVHLYGEFHAPGTPNALTSLELDRQTAI